MFTETHLPSILTDLRTKASDQRGSFMALRIRMAIHGDDQRLLDPWARIPGKEGVSDLFQGETTPWKAIVLEARTPVTLAVLMGQQELQVPVVLVGIKVSRTYDKKAGVDLYTYTFDLEKDLDPEQDKDLPHLVKARNERGDLIEWPILWTLRTEEQAGQEYPIDG